MSAPENTYRHVQAERDDKGRLQATGTLKKGIKIGSEQHKSFVMREINTGDLLDAEREATTDTALNYNAAVLVRQLVKIGSFEGPFTIGMIRALPPGDFNTLREAQAELSIAGEVEQ